MKRKLAITALFIGSITALTVLPTSKAKAWDCFSGSHRTVCVSVADGIWACLPHGDEVWIPC